ncbi:hypothetical protein [Actinomadura xylanilytica]|uniref:hypothetical protein n=1 Tax=Actinomadura xylanilytica TaxID=887459 RepID=UPI00255B38BF|nr:hypothetical protein [Actinomadura xylanilytica]MDL4770696.1 hypothetical protein [Actinomadura xylanilytica]
MDDRQTGIDENVERVAAELRESVRALNHLTAGPPGLTRPSTVYTALGSLTEAAYGLAQASEQFDRFLDAELSAGRLGHDRGEKDLVPAMLRAHDALAEAGERTSELSNSFARAQVALNAIRPRTADADVASQISREVEAAAVDQPRPTVTEAPAAGADFPVGIDDALRAGRVGQDSPDKHPDQRSQGSRRTP